MKPKVSISQADDDDEDEKQSLENDKIVDQENQHQVKKNGDTVISSQLLGVFWVAWTRILLEREWSYW